jgi:hypothetical protein
MTEKKARATAKAKATTRTTAGPSATLRFAQDDRFVWVAGEGKGKCKGNGKSRSFALLWMTLSSRGVFSSSGWIWFLGIY